MIANLSARVIGFIIAGVVALLVIWAAVHFWQRSKSAGTQARVSQGEAGAAIDSGQAATNTLGGVLGNDAATDAAVAQGQAEIRAAPEGQKGAATKAAACRLKAYATSPQCREPKP